MGHFYMPFASKLFQVSQGGYDVSIVSHAGHSPGHYKDSSNLLTPPSDSTGEIGDSTGEIGDSTTKTGDSCVSATDWYCLQDQVYHKLAFIEEEARGRDSIILIGHSIGCWMILQMLERMESSRISKIFLLFPTIEKMALTPNGQSALSYAWSSLRTPITGLVWLCARFMPDFVKKWLLSQHFYTTPSEHLQPMIQGVANMDEKSVHNVLKMARQEMDEVLNPPLTTIDQNIGKIVFYYGVGDKWNVESCYSDMAARYPAGGNVHLCEHNIDHAFVECSSDQMVEYILSELVKLKII